VLDLGGAPPGKGGGVAVLGQAKGIPEAHWGLDAQLALERLNREDTLFYALRLHHGRATGQRTLAQKGRASSNPQQCQTSDMRCRRRARGRAGSTGDLGLARGGPARHHPAFRAERSKSGPGCAGREAQAGGHGQLRGAGAAQGHCA